MDLFNCGEKMSRHRWCLQEKIIFSSAVCLKIPKLYISDVCHSFDQMFLLYLGGPEFCQEDLQSNYTFGNNNSQVINVILCGVPAPVVHWKYPNGDNFAAKRELINAYTYKYMPPKVTQKSCGRELTFHAKGKATLERKLLVFLAKCKCQDFVFL